VPKLKLERARGKASGPRSTNEMTHLRRILLRFLVPTKVLRKGSGGGRKKEDATAALSDTGATDIVVEAPVDGIGNVTVAGSGGREDGGLAQDLMSVEETEIDMMIGIEIADVIKKQGKAKNGTGIEARETCNGIEATMTDTGMQMAQDPNAATIWYSTLKRMVMMTDMRTRSNDLMLGQENVHGQKTSTGSGVAMWPRCVYFSVSGLHDLAAKNTQATPRGQGVHSLDITFAGRGRDTRANCGANHESSH
jgi:hypothetical protein